ncbi:hypothetical protein F5X99DRAFT_411880 [Biscogniauxia marginata]|nr:hypothetical protein F5X99DRAFT_411880 [Biscogniauxia marginata]
MERSFLPTTFIPAPPFAFSTGNSLTSTHSQGEHNRPRAPQPEYNNNLDEYSNFQKEDDRPRTRSPEHVNMPDESYYVGREDGPSGTQPSGYNDDSLDDSFSSTGESDQPDNHSNSTKKTTPDHSPTREEMSKESRSILRSFRVPEWYYFKYWDGENRPFVLWASVFDAKSLGEWIYNWTFYYYRDEEKTLTAVRQFQTAFAQLDRNVAKVRKWSIGMQEDTKGFIKRGIVILDDIESLVKFCALPILEEKAQRRDEETDRHNEEGGGEGSSSKGKARELRHPKTDSARGIVDAFLDSEGFEELSLEAEAWNREFKRRKLDDDNISSTWDR